MPLTTAIKHTLIRHWAVSLIFCLWLVLVLRNYSFGTFLSGWDTLHPEFNFLLNIQRTVSGVWREEQGLGAIAAHAHMSDLPRILLLWISSVIIPLSFLRYFYVFGCLLAGALGVYAFVRYISRERAILVSQTAGLVAALFYTFNLGTVQHFYVPFEMFTTQYATLGWLFLGVLHYLEAGKKRVLVLFCLATLAAAPMAYAFALWYAYFLGLTLFVGAYCIQNRRKVILKRAGLILAVTFLINSFWILPNWYFLATEAKQVPLAKSNRLFSPEAYLHNQEFGTLKDAAIFKNFLFDWKEWKGDDVFGPLLGTWSRHLQSPIVSGTGYLFFILSLIGLAVGFKQKRLWVRALVPVSIVACIMLIPGTPGISQVLDALRKQSNILEEGLRFPFTKFSILLMFSMAVYLGVAVEQISHLLAWQEKPEGTAPGLPADGTRRKPGAGFRTFLQAVSAVSLPEV